MYFSIHLSNAVYQPGVVSTNCSLPRCDFHKDKAIQVSQILALGSKYAKSQGNVAVRPF